MRTPNLPTLKMVIFNLNRLITHMGDQLTTSSSNAHGLSLVIRLRAILGDLADQYFVSENYMSAITNMNNSPSGPNHAVMDELRGALFNIDNDISTTLREVLIDEERTANLTWLLNERDHNADYADMLSYRHQTVLELERSKSFDKSLRNAEALTKLVTSSSSSSSSTAPNDPIANPSQSSAKTQTLDKSNPKEASIAPRSASSTSTSAHAQTAMVETNLQDLRGHLTGTFQLQIDTNPSPSPKLMHQSNPLEPRSPNNESPMRLQMWLTTLHSDSSTPSASYPPNYNSRRTSDISTSSSHDGPYCSTTNFPSYRPQYRHHHILNLKCRSPNSTTIAEPIRQSQPWPQPS